ncbi:MAG: EamA family transporter [Bacteriovoracaceae bacterium]
MRAMVIFNFFSIYFFWGSSFIANKIIMKEVPPLFTAGCRFSLAALFFHFIYLYEKKRAAKHFAVIDRKNFVKIAISGVLLFGLGSGFLILGQVGVSTGEASLWMALIPLFMLMIDYPFFKGRKPNLLDFISLIIGFFGIYVVSMDNLNVSGSSLLYSLLLSISALAWAFGSFIQKSVNSHISLFNVCKWQMIIGSIALFTMSFFNHEMNLVSFKSLSLTTWYFIFHLSFFSSVIAFGSFSQLLKEVDAQKVSTYAYVNPIIALFLGYYFLNERIGPKVIVGAVLVLISIMLVLNNPW